MLCDWHADNGQRACWREAYFQIQDRKVCRFHTEILKDALARVNCRKLSIRLVAWDYTIRAARRVVDIAMTQMWEREDDPMNKYVGFTPPYHVPEWVRKALYRLGVSPAELVTALDDMARLEGKFTTNGAPPHAYNQMSYVTVELL